MSDSFSIDLDGLARFRAAMERMHDRVGELKGLAEGAGLAPGTFTRTPGGQRADAAHAELVDGIGGAVESAVKGLRAIAEAAGRTMDNYKATDEKHAAAMSEMGRLLDSSRGYRS